ncbi:MAG: hypothetical protein ACHQ9S_07955 [Candidatus Binatia bacterium]
MHTRWFTYGTFALLTLALWGFSYRLGSMPLLDEPPLTYWLIGAADLAFGVNEFSARLPGALAGVFVVRLLVHSATAWS